VQEAAHAKGFQLHVLRVSSEGEIETAFATLVQPHAGAQIVAFLARREQLVARHGVPAMYEWREFAAVSGLSSYGSSLAGAYVGRILAGAKPADLPVQPPATFELVVNLTTAKTLGLTIPPSILALADEVNE